MLIDHISTHAASLGIDLIPDQLAKLEALACELLAWNRRANLTRIVDPREVETRHFLDSLTCALPLLNLIGQDESRRCIDVGSGAGFPGLPLAIAFPSLDMTLLEATGKKVRFLEHAVAQLDLPNVSVVSGRAEEVACDPQYRDSYDFAFARALASLPVALELCLPFVRSGGLVVLPRGSDPGVQVAAGELAAAELSARLLPPFPVPLPVLPEGRRLIVAEKISDTVDRYPRRVGVAVKRPLGFPKLPIA